MILIVNAGCSQTYNEQIKKLEQFIINNPMEYLNYEKLSFLVSEQYLDLNKAQRMGIRKFLFDHVRFSNININPPGEAGIPIHIKGIVQDEQGLVLKNVKILIFHTDAYGYYAPDDSVKHTMNEADSRLFAFILTDERGQYEFQTIHPGTYPKKYLGRSIPQHIHLEIDFPGYQAFNIQMAFEDDPAMKDPYWQDWAVKLKYPVIQFAKDDKGYIGVYDIKLVKK